MTTNISASEQDESSRLEQCGNYCFFCCGTLITSAVILSMFDANANFHDLAPIKTNHSSKNDRRHTHPTITRMFQDKQKPKNI